MRRDSDFWRMVRRRLPVFRENRRGYVSLWLLAAAFFVSLFAEVICNSRPIVAHYQGRTVFPIWQNYPETAFGGQLGSTADFLDPLVRQAFEQPGNWAIYPPVGFRYDDIDFSLEEAAPAPPSRRHWLGTDDRGRDVLSRLVYGFRLSMFFGLGLALVSSVIGTAIGAVQGYYGGRVDLVGQRLTELWICLPELYVLIVLASLFAPSIALIFALLALFNWVGLSAYVRAEYLKARGLAYVESAITLGASPAHVMWRHILPNALTPVLTFFPFRFAASLTGLVALDFLGLGVPPPTPSLGELLSQGKDNLDSWWIIVATFVVIVATITMLSFIGEALRSAADPKMTRRLS